MNNDIDDLLFFVDETATTNPLATSPSLPAWQVLVVDDDADVHEATRFALDGILIFDRPLTLIHAYSAAEALERLRQPHEVAVILLDVVMETHTAGLEIIDVIRGELGLHNTRIILRTGQPGYAPEIDTIRRYDINDYKTKSELTRNKLFTTLSSALRTYDQLCRLDASKRGLEQIVVASRQLMSRREMQCFAKAALAQLAQYAGVPEDGLICGGNNLQQPTEFMVFAGGGRYEMETGRHAGEVLPNTLLQRLDRCLSLRRSLIEADGISLYLSGAEGDVLTGFLHLPQPIVLDRNLFEVFCANIALGGDNVRLVEKLQESAFTDILTGLPNRAGLIDTLDRCIKQQDLDHFALVLIDIDQFSAINDLFGHRYGDQVLIAVANRLEQHFSDGYFVSRIGNDTFALLGAKHALTPSNIRELFSRPFTLDDTEHQLSVTLAVLSVADSYGSGADRLKDAWITIKRAKARGQGQDAYFSQSINREMREHTRLLQALREAFEYNRLFIAYQPQLCCRTERVLGVEALLRWRHDDGKMISPASFIPVAESSGLIISLGEWVLRSALNAVGAMRRSHPDLIVAVNVSAVQFAHPNFLNMVDLALADSGIPAQALELEVTESVAILGAEAVEQIFYALKTRGISLAIDDFGTGFSSLSYLDRLPADRIKIDRSFVNALESGNRGARIAEMVIPLGKQLGMKVLAEGVETESQAQKLRDLGCAEVQGFLYAKPMPLDEILPWLEERP